jgi:hypothetical protein
MFCAAIGRLVKTLITQIEMQPVFFLQSYKSMIKIALLKQKTLRF